MGAHVRCAPPLFASTITISRFGEAFVMVSTVWSVFVCWHSTHGAPRAQPFVKVEREHVPYESAPLHATRQLQCE